MFVQEVSGVIDQLESERWASRDIKSLIETHTCLSCEHQELLGAYKAKCCELEALQRDHDSRVLQVHALKRELTAARHLFDTQISHKSLDFKKTKDQTMKQMVLSVAEVEVERANVEHEATVDVLKGHCNSVIRSIKADEEKSRSGLSLIEMSYFGRAAEICKSSGLHNIPLNFAIALVDESLSTKDDEALIFAKILSDQSYNVHQVPHGRRWSEEVKMYYNERFLGKYSKRAQAMDELNLVVPSASTLAVSDIGCSYMHMWLVNFALLSTDTSSLYVPTETAEENKP